MWSQSYMFTDGECMSALLCHVGIKYREFISDERPAIKLVEAPGDVISGLTKNDV